ncbi:hypothetical protein FOA52_006942 [Chlamydomonas sp. UWO 241]|nr:hypothetical protein FOA52_006942 [Chlamydomonas sp. UWO 241]
MSRPNTSISVRSNRVEPEPSRPSTSAVQKVYAERKEEFIRSTEFLVEVLYDDSTDATHIKAARDAVNGVTNAMQKLLDGAVQQSNGRAAVPVLGKQKAATASKIIGGIAENLSSLPYAGPVFSVIATFMSFAADYLVLDDARFDLCLDVVELFELLLPLAYTKKKQEEFLDNHSGKVHIYMLKRAVARALNVMKKEDAGCWSWLMAAAASKALQGDVDAAAAVLSKARHDYWEMVQADGLSPAMKAEVVASYERQEEERIMRPPRVVLPPKSSPEAEPAAAAATAASAASAAAAGAVARQQAIDNNEVNKVAAAAVAARVEEAAAAAAVAAWKKEQADKTAKRAAEERKMAAAAAAVAAAAEASEAALAAVAAEKKAQSEAKRKAREDEYLAAVAIKWNKIHQEENAAIAAEMEKERDRLAAAEAVAAGLARMKALEYDRWWRQNGGGGITIGGSRTPLQEAKDREFELYWELYWEKDERMKLERQWEKEKMAVARAVAEGVARARAMEYARNQRAVMAVAMANGKEKKERAVAAAAAAASLREEKKREKVEKAKEQQEAEEQEAAARVARETKEQQDREEQEEAARVESEAKKREDKEEKEAARVKAEKDMEEKAAAAAARDHWWLC